MNIHHLGWQLTQLSQCQAALPPHSFLETWFLEHQMVGGLLKLYFSFKNTNSFSFLYFILNIPGYGALGLLAFLRKQRNELVNYEHSDINTAAKIQLICHILPGQQRRDVLGRDNQMTISTNLLLQVGLDTTQLLFNAAQWL